MFGRKKKELPAGARLMHYEGLPGFAQDMPCFMEQTLDALVFRQMEGPAVTLPLSKINSVDVLEERNYMAKYKGHPASTSRTNAVKWYGVFTYDTTKQVVVWFLSPKDGKVLWDLQKQRGAAGGDITL